jgi:flagellar basal-body rod protein FlgC
MGIGSLFDISASAMDAQTTRLRVIAENLANQDTTGSAPGADPYRRKTVTFRDVVDQAGTPLVEVSTVGRDNSDFGTRYDPSHPAANADGYVKTPNVNSFVEMMDMREAERSYSANLNVMQMTRTMLNRTIDLLK